MRTPGKDFWAKLVGDFISIPSVNPAFGGSGELLLGNAVAGHLERAGLQVRQQEVSPGRFNVMARVGPENRPALLLEAHLDTVAVEDWQEGDPFQPVIRNDRLYGRGACDTKGSLALFLAVTEYFASAPDKLAPPLLFAATVDEEENQTGAFRLMEAGLPILGAITGEPTRLRIIHAHKGLLRFRVRTVGEAAHAAFPERGINAIVRMIPVIAELEKMGDELRAGAPDPTLGHASMSIGTIHGGLAVNVVPAACAIEVDRRLLPREEPAMVLSEIRGRLEKLPGVAVESPWLDRPGIHTPMDHPLARQLANAVRKAEGGEDPFQTAPYMTNATAFAAAGIPSLVFGPGDIEQAHTRSEYVELSQLETGFRILVDFLHNFRP